MSKEWPDDSEPSDLTRMHVFAHIEDGEYGALVRVLFQAVPGKPCPVCRKPVARSATTRKRGAKRT